MPDWIPETSYIKQFSDAFEHEYMYGTEGSILRPTCVQRTQEGEMAFIDFLGETEGQERTERNPNTPNMAMPHTRRKSVIVPWDWGTLIDTIDKLKMAKDPQGDYSRIAGAAYAKYVDMKILEKLGAIVYTGKEGTTAVNFYDVGEGRIIDSAGVLVAAGSQATDKTETHLTVAKVAKVGLIMDENNVPRTDRHFVASSTNMWAFIQESDVKTYDVNTVKALAAGTLTDFMGFHFHWLPTSYFETDAVDKEAIKGYAYHKWSIACVTGEGANSQQTDVYKRGDKCNNVQLYLMRTVGATRLQGKGVVQILLKAAA